MADPLSEVADRYAPPKTNFFDPAAGQGVLSRYGNSRLGLKESEGLANAVGELNRDRLDRSREQRFDRQAEAEEKRFGHQVKMDEAQLKREELLADADELEAADRRTARESRAGFLLSLGKLDPQDPEIDIKLNDLLSGLPPGLLENDDVAKNMLQVIDRSANDSRAARKATADKEQTLQNQLTVLQERRKYDAGLKGLTDEDLQAAITPDGELDPFVLGNLAGRRQTERELGTFKDKQDEYQKNREKTLGIQNDEWRERQLLQNEEWLNREGVKEANYGKRFETKTAVEDRRAGESNEEWDRRSAAQQEQRKEMEGIRMDNRKTLLATSKLSSGGAKRQEIVKQHLSDEQAFPKHEAVLAEYAKGAKIAPTLVETKLPDQLAKAKEWDKNQLFKELDAAYDTDSAEEYVKLGPKDLTEKQKQKRRDVWEHAFRDLPFATAEPTTPAAPEGRVDDYVPPTAAPAAPVKRKVIGGVAYEHDGQGWKKAKD